MYGRDRRRLFRRTASVVSRLQGPAGGVVGIRAGPQPTLPQDDTLRGSVRRPGRKRGRHTGGTAHDTSSVRDSCRARRGGPAGGVVEVRAGPHSTRPPDGTPARALRVHGATNYTTKPVHARYYHRPKLHLKRTDNRGLPTSYGHYV